jgi:HAE1 family hydrophobic/amphiphilic exporter-1
MKRCLYLSVIFWIFSVSPCLRGGFSNASAAEVRTLTLEQALSIAMEKNRDIEKAREYARSVQGKYVEERSAALPQLSLNGSVAFTRDDSQGALFGGNSFRQNTRAVDVTLSQPLFTWGKVGAAIRAARVGLKTADEQLRLYRQAVHRDVTAAFYDVLLSRELSTQAVENLAQKKRHLDEAQRKFAAGTATDYDVLAAEVSVENTRPDVIRSENSIRTAREQLRFLLALEAEDVDAVGTLEESTPARQREYAEALATALKQRPELADLKLRIGIYTELVTIAGADDKPRLDLKGSAGWHWLETAMGGPARDGNGGAWLAGLYLSFPFFDGMRTRGRVTQAQSDLRSKQIEEARLKDSVALEVRDTDNALRESAEIVQALSGTVKQAERLLQMAEKGYEFGVKIRLEVDDAQLNLLQARSNLARARRDYRVAQVNYQWAMGVAGE